MGKILLWVIIVIVLLGAGFGLWGYFKAQEVKKQGQEIEQITADTLVLKKISTSDVEISLAEWKNLAEEAPKIKSELEKISAIPSSLKDKISQFYETQAQDKYKEAQYLQILLEGQRKLDLKNLQPKSKGQIETVLNEFDKMQTKINQNNLALGPSLNKQLAKVDQEATLFKNSLTDLASKMNYESPAVQLSTAGLDKAIDDLKLAIIESLNEWVALQDQIKTEISNLANKNWIMPF